MLWWTSSIITDLRPSFRLGPSLLFGLQKQLGLVYLLIMHGSARIVFALWLISIKILIFKVIIRDASLGAAVGSYFTLMAQAAMGFAEAYLVSFVDWLWFWAVAFLDLELLLFVFFSQNHIFYGQIFIQDEGLAFNSV